ncbi:hypothetical protein PTSG_04845 [Salpingoeca rosetta]|uniref:Uncharacterized protein n=1 Tax=Salpingoeca rosetta (strain ATCC 50818 / BSB-021) TaxID=946362 RepID=F2U9V5_SALR5|nr:uncharacterized protein PTSG_04845 [Salpingoeca rosetta]EGD73132.1 hypothetical protein PTSG_04845 [Salpingoeca rosetta]|eukprot:XP_004994163.1 hypothetical protein PTSG_04845 [Salpingoeca rosetta]
MSTTAEGPSSEPTCMSRVQGPVQAVLRPGQWCFGVRAIRQGSEQWRASCSVDALVQALKTAVADFQEGRPESGLTNTRKVRIAKAISNDTRGFVRIENYTQTSEWLDVVEVHIKPVAADANACTAFVKSFSSGFLPTCIPCAPLLNMALFWIPFSDFTDKGSLNKVRIEELRTKLSASITVSVETQ